MLRLVQATHPGLVCARQQGFATRSANVLTSVPAVSTQLHGRNGTARDHAMTGTSMARSDRIAALRGRECCPVHLRRIMPQPLLRSP
jgi:hypothetical protein